MFEIVKAIHDAIRTESTLAFVLVIAALFAFLGGSTAWVVDTAYKRSQGETKIERHLSEWQRVKIISNLSRYTGQKAVILASEGVDTWSYAREFRDVLGGAGWKVRGPLPAPASAPAVDVQVSVNVRYFGSTPPEPLLTLQGTLKFVEVRCRDLLVMDPKVPPSVAVIWVVAKGTIPPSSYPPLEVRGVEIPEEF
jgi:hypothetical protein